MFREKIKTLMYLVFGLITLIMNSCLLTKFIPNNSPSSAENEITSSIVNIDFPSENIDYPLDWPEELRIPNGILLVDSASGVSLEGDKKGWLGKFRFEGDPSEAERIISNHFTDSGWKIRKIGEFTSGGFVLLVEKDQGDGLIVLDIDPNDASQLIISVSFYP